MTIVLVSACSLGSSPISSQKSIDAAPSAEFRVVQHVLGETAIPIHPQRILALSGTTDLDTLLALGIRPMAAGVDPSYHAVHGFFSHFKDKADGIQAIPAWPQSNLEQILQLNPDLILGQRNYVEPIYDQLSQIAPTFVYENPIGKPNWRATFREIAVAMGQSDKGEQVLDDLEQRLGHLRKSLSENHKQPEISVIFYWTEDRSIYTIFGKRSFGGSLLEELGLQRPVTQQFDDLSQNVSIELAAHADGDIMFLLDYNEPEQVDQLLASPLWSQLKAVKNQQIYRVSNIHWYTPGVLAAHAVLDDIEQYVLGQSPAQSGDSNAF
ncbi:iron-siderophore ABC transporter substrate-binding protein [Leptolyngbya sp. 7M]|uniref:iron-siderophore ABC transporter substrate-binding protein n=1 Tax=Leptolyngbya sp. 7M TaxID=2812896 RepID=UPI001B8D0A10|nr:iron-siderophore ABC transporter substrate-binding protein [Leptolyngbya sp. 7M]QYO64278.1 iron-siderophore ABC transporter substrate-binding protein [Leptolyngbya sp. 7M]